jgi:hypothetical protein
MNRLVQVLSLSMLGIALSLSPLSTIASDDKAIAEEGGLEGLKGPVLEAQPFSTAETEIRPSHWTYQVLKSLVERYGCAQNITNTPSNPFNPIRSMTRHEVAVTWGICLAKIGDRFISKQDQKMAVALQREFKTEINTLLANGGEFDANSTTLEAQQFYTEDTKSHPEVFYVPSDWIVQSLTELTGRYTCVMGLNRPFPSQTSYGRSELASWVNACIEQIGGRFNTQRDRDLSQKLQIEFKTDLATIKARNDSLKARIAEFEKQKNSAAKLIADRVLPDVKPTQWNAVKSLVLKYNCISGLPSGLFQPNRRTTRYELAAALNACLRRNNNHFATQPDRELAQNLQQEFKTELAEIRNRTNELEARAATLEFKQFSPTSKLQGQTVITIQGGGF